MPSSIRFGHPAGSGACACTGAASADNRTTVSAVLVRMLIWDSPFGAFGGQLQDTNDARPTQRVLAHPYSFGNS